MKNAIHARSPLIAQRIIACVIFLGALAPAFAETLLMSAMDRVTARLTAKLPQEKLLKLDEETLYQYLTTDDLRIFATKYWCFDSDIPVTVYVMRPAAQKTIPFWLEDRQFEKTNLTVRNKLYEYEVWKKQFKAGRIELGIPGFEKHRPDYFVAVASIESGKNPQLTNFNQTEQQTVECRVGAFTYLDWPDLLLTEVPAEIRGATLLPTSRGRARESHLLGAVLTWSADPCSTQTIQWRMPANGEGSGEVLYKAVEQDQSTPMKRAIAHRSTYTDRFIVNEASVDHFTVTLRDLASDTHYIYRVGRGKNTDTYSPPAQFKTAPSKSTPFTFLFMTDTHNSPDMADLFKTASEKSPNAAFCVISGDLVNTGQYRDTWDSFFHYGAEFFSTHPLTPCMGNHDCIDGLGAELYLGLLELPKNGPPRLDPERAYSFEYGDALFIMADATEDIARQARWLDAKLSSTKTKWKFVIFHFPPYAPNDPNPEIVKEWLPIFDKHHVDFVLGGHVHDYLRTFPMKDGKRVASSTEGVVYLTSISEKSSCDPFTTPDYAAAVDVSGEALFSTFSIEKDSVVLRTFTSDGKSVDKAEFKK
jgi:hypothetical protein